MLRGFLGPGASLPGRSSFSAASSCTRSFAGGRGVRTCSALMHACAHTRTDACVHVHVRVHAHGAALKNPRPVVEQVAWFSRRLSGKTVRHGSDTVRRRFLVGLSCSLHCGVTLYFPCSLYSRPGAGAATRIQTSPESPPHSISAVPEDKSWLTEPGSSGTDGELGSTILTGRD